VASGDVMKVAGFRAVYPYGVKKDEQLPALEVGEEVALTKLNRERKETEPPARYSQGKLIQEMEKRGLGTKSTRASIIERLYTVKYLKNNPCEPSQLGMAIIEALDTYAPQIVTPEMTSDLERDMSEVAAGEQREVDVVDRSRELLASLMDTLLEHTDDIGEALADAITADARVGTCPKCGKDLVMKTSHKNRSSFIGCQGWPDCDVTYPVPKGRIEPVEGACPTCGAPRIKVQPFRQKAYEMCVNPACDTNREPDVVVGTCPTCAAAGKHGDLVAHKSEFTGKRFIRCTNYEECETSYPLPQRGKLEATGETCPSCGAPVVDIVTERGPWRVCVNMECPAKAEKSASARGRGRGKAAGKSGSKAGTKAGTKKTAAKKTTAKKATAKKTTKKAAGTGAAE
jgi:DNA topoisomerase-1